MSQLLAMVCNDPDRIRCALHPVRESLLAMPDAATRPRGFDAWGIGLYQGGDVLLKRRPQPTNGPVDFYAIAGELRTDTFIAHVRSASVGDNRNENTHPFRFRSWLFAHHGTVPGFGPAFGSPDIARPSEKQAALYDALLSEIPDFLRRNLRGQTDSELLFHLFLTRLHDAGQLDLTDIRLADAQVALAHTIERLDRVLHAHDLPTDERGPLGVLTLANGRFLLAAARGDRAYLHRVDGLKDCAVCRETAHQPSGPARPVDHDHLRAVVVLAGKSAPPGEQFRSFPAEGVASGTIIAVARDLTITTTPLGA